MNPLVSIIIPVYNRELYLKECVDSVLNQTYQNIEIIAVDDGSTDGSLEILNDYQNRYPSKIKIITKSNGGVSAARNAGIKFMKGEWLEMVDSDDVLYPSAVEEFMSFAKKIKTKKIITYSNIDYIDLKGHIIGHKLFENYNHLDDKTVNCILLDHILGGTGNILIHKSAFDYVMFDESLIVCEDYDLFLKLCLLHGFRLYSIQKSLVKGRKHSNSLTIENGHTIFRTNQEIKQNIINQLEESEQEYYKKGLKKLWKNMPLQKKIRRTIPIIMTNIIGESMTDKFIYFYTKRIRKFS